MSQQHCLCVQTPGVCLDLLQIMSLYCVSGCLCRRWLISQYFVDLQGTNTPGNKVLNDSFHMIFSLHSFPQ